METSQRVVKEIVDRDNQQISTLLDGMGRLVEILNNSYSVMQDFSNFAAEYKAPNIVTENIIHVSVLEANFSNIRDAANRLKSRASVSHKNTKKPMIFLPNPGKVLFVVNLGY